MGGVVNFHLVRPNLVSLGQMSLPDLQNTLKVRLDHLGSNDLA